MSQSYHSDGIMENGVGEERPLDQSEFKRKGSGCGILAAAAVISIGILMLCGAYMMGQYLSNITYGGEKVVIHGTFVRESIIGNGGRVIHVVEINTLQPRFRSIPIVLSNPDQYDRYQRGDLVEIRGRVIQELGKDEVVVESIDLEGAGEGSPAF